MLAMKTQLQGKSLSIPSTPFQPYYFPCNSSIYKFWSYHCWIVASYLVHILWYYDILKNWNILNKYMERLRLSRFSILRLENWFRGYPHYSIRLGFKWMVSSGARTCARIMVWLSRSSSTASTNNRDNWELDLL